ncbi:hypothetical protein [Oceanobacillus sp. 1P07AA]|uniref:hypothetical protein n=1 Tax=Oceanobacillus sp. 1P07AA TaxID=3132293 RepID=UPI0039A40138
MADKTIGFKISEDLQQKTQMMIESSGLSNKDWFQKAVALVEQSELKEGSPEHKHDLIELETHTTRIYELVANMVQRSNYLKDQSTRELQEKIEQKESTITEFQEKAKTAIESAKEMKTSLEQTKQEVEDLEKALEETRVNNENNLDLINQYKEKNDTLTGLVNEYKSYKEDNETLKQMFAEERTQLNDQIAELSEGNVNNISIIEELRKGIEDLTQNNKIEIEQIKERKELEKDKALLETERKYADEITRMSTEHNETVKSLYDEMNNIRKEYEERINMLQEEHKNELNKVNKKKQ